MKPLYLLLPALALGCTGMVNSSGGSDGTNDSPGSTIGAGSASSAGSASGSSPGAVTGTEVMTQPTWRLTNAEYVNSVRDLLGITLTTPLDPDGAAAGFSAGLQAGDATVQAYHSAAMEASAQSAALLKLVPCDAATITASPADCAAKGGLVLRVPQCELPHACAFARKHRYATFRSHALVYRAIVDPHRQLGGTVARPLVPVVDGQPSCLRLRRRRCGE